MTHKFYCFYCAFDGNLVECESSMQFHDNHDNQEMFKCPKCGWIQKWTLSEIKENFQDEIRFTEENIQDWKELIKQIEELENT